MQSELPPLSPCTRVCRLDAAQFCIGCFRHLSEITAWLSMTPAEQRQVIAAAAQRAAAARAGA